jgi:hypothetical protein
MAQDDPSSSSDKGKGKVVDGDLGAAGSQKDKDGKPQVNGKKEEEKPNCTCKHCWAKFELTA